MVCTSVCASEERTPTASSSTIRVRSDDGEAGTAVALKRQRINPPPGKNRFDSWSVEDIFASVEAQMMGAVNQMDTYRRSPYKEKAQALALMAADLETVSESLAALRRRVANDKRFE